MPLTLKDQSAALTVGATTGTEVYGKSSYTKSGGGGASALDDLTDVIISSATIYDHLEYNGSNWVNLQNLTLNTTAKLYLRAGTTKYLSADSGTTMDFHVGAGESYRFYDDTTLLATRTSLSETFLNGYIITSAGSLVVKSGAGGTLTLGGNSASTAVFLASGTQMQFQTSNELLFRATTQRIYSSAASTLDIDANTTVNYRIGGAVDLIHTVGSLSGNGSFLFTSIGTTTLNGALGSQVQYNGANRIAATSAGVTLFAGEAATDYTLTFDGETNDGVITWMEDEDYFKFSDDVLMDSTERIYFNDTSQSIYGSSATTLAIEADAEVEILFSGTQAGEYFNFTKVVANVTDYKSRLTFASYDSDAPGFADAGYIDGLVSFAIPKMGYNVSAGGTHVFAIGGTDVLTVSASIGNYAMVGNTTGSALYLGGGTEVYIMIGLGSIVASSATSSFYYSGSTFNIGGNSASGRTLNLNNGGIGSFTCNIVSSTEWSFTSTELTVGTGNNIYIQGGGQSRYRDSTTYVYSSATNTLDLVVSSSSRAVLTAGALTMGSATTIVCAAATTSIPSIRVPAGTAPTSPTEGDVWNDSTQKCPVNFVDGMKVYGGGIIYSQVTNKAVANTVTETTLLDTTNATGSLTLPANWWTRGKVCRITATGVFSTKSGTTPTGRMRLFKGSTELATSGTKTIPDMTGTTRLWTCVFYVTGLSTAFTSVMTQGMFNWINAAASVGATHGFEVNNQTGGVSTAVTIGATSEALDLKWTWGTADALDTITCTNVIIEVIA